MLSWNQRKVRQLTPLEIWLFIVGRVLSAFGLGLPVAQYLPGVAFVGWAALATGAVLLVLAWRGLVRGARSDS